jgi:hypothetical protein
VLVEKLSKSALIWTQRKLVAFATMSVNSSANTWKEIDAY